MSEFGDFFDQKKSEKKDRLQTATQERARRATEEQERALERIRPLVAIVDPVLANASEELAKKNVSIQRNRRLDAYDINARPHTSFRLQPIGTDVKNSSVYLFELYGEFVVTSRCDPLLDYRNSDERLLRVPIGEFSASHVTDIVKQAIGEVFED
jgi:hypothetical protein